jgi:hypothetical protein
VELEEPRYPSEPHQSFSFCFFLFFIYKFFYCKSQFGETFTENCTWGVAEAAASYLMDNIPFPSHCKWYVPLYILRVVTDEVFLICTSHVLVVALIQKLHVNCGIQGKYRTVTDLS